MSAIGARPLVGNLHVLNGLRFTLLCSYVSGCALVQCPCRSVSQSV